MSETDTDQDEAGDAKKKFMFVNRKAPHGTIYAHELLEMMLIAGAYEQDITVVFMDDGVFDIRKGQDPKPLGIKNFAAAYRALDGYDIEKLYVDEDSLKARGLSEDDLMVDVEVKSSAEIARLMQEQDLIITG